MNEQIRKLVALYCTEQDDHDFPKDECQKCSEMTEAFSVLFASLASPTVEQEIGVSFGPISEAQKEYIYRGELPPAEQQKKLPELLADLKRHTDAVILLAQVINREFQMDGAAQEEK